MQHASLNVTKFQEFYFLLSQHSHKNNCNNYTDMRLKQSFFHGAGDKVMIKSCFILQERPRTFRLPNYRMSDTIPRAYIIYNKEFIAQFHIIFHLSFCTLIYAMTNHQLIMTRMVAYQYSNSKCALK